MADLRCPELLRAEVVDKVVLKKTGIIDSYEIRKFLGGLMVFWEVGSESINSNFWRDNEEVCGKWVEKTRSKFWFSGVEFHTSCSRVATLLGARGFGTYSTIWSFLTFLSSSRRARRRAALAEEVTLISTHP